MTEATRTETHSFQAEVKQLLHLMVHSLYSNKEIFLRELISNASDAADKLNFLALKDDSLFEGDGDLRIWIEADKEARTLTLRDNGVGMSRDEVVENLGTIARSGTMEFLRNLSGDERRDSRLIGQFGVGFYSAFIVASRVEVYTRKAGAPADEGVYWASDGSGEFELGSVQRPARGTGIVLHLKEGEDEFLEPARLKTLVRKYSDHISVPVMMAAEKPADDDSDAPGEEQVNTATALWTRNPSEISDEEYQDFYRHISHDFGDALTWAHNRVEGTLDYTSLLYVPARAPFDLWQRDGRRGLKLYVQRVFIMDEAEQFLPLYLRFIKGVIDSNDLSLNISREILQNDRTVASLRKALTRRVLDMLEKLAENQPDKYREVWAQFGQVLKEGAAEDPGNSEKISKLLRFASTHSGEPAQTVSLADYQGRMKEGQKHIYYVVADSHQAALGSPHLEVFRKKGIEVLLLSEPVDEWLVTHLHDYEGTPLKDVARGELDLGELEDEADKQAQEQTDEAFAELTDRIAAELSAQVASVRTTSRLTDSPACLVVGEQDLGPQLRRMLEAAGQSVPESKPVLEINPQHPLLQRLSQESNQQRARDLITVIHDQARLAGGEGLTDPAAYVQRINKLLLELAGDGKARRASSGKQATTAGKKTPGKKAAGPAGKAAAKKSAGKGKGATAGGGKKS